MTKKRSYSPKTITPWIYWYARQDSNPPEVDFAVAQPAAYGFEDQDSQNSKILWFQPVDSIQLFQLTFDFVWNCLETFDLDGHNLGTILRRHERGNKNCFSSLFFKICIKSWPHVPTFVWGSQIWGRDIGQRPARRNGRHMALSGGVGESFP